MLEKIVGGKIGEARYNEERCSLNYFINKAGCINSNRLTSKKIDDENYLFRPDEFLSKSKTIVSHFNISGGNSPKI